MLWVLSGDAWLGIRGLNKKKRTAALVHLVNENKVIKVEVEGIKHSFYIRDEEEQLLDKILNSFDNNQQQLQPQAAIIAPLDNLFVNLF